MIPNNFIPINVLISPSATSYFDTGIVPSDDLEIDGIFYVGISSSTNYVFGARNTNSNTSAGQINMELVPASSSATVNTGTIWCGYNNARLQGIGYINTRSKIYFSKRINEVTVYSGEACKTISGNANAFTGTRNMYLLARNNAGTVQTGGGVVGVYAFRVGRNGTLLKNYVPVFNETDNTYGFYDLVNNVYENLSGNDGQYHQYVYTLEVASNGNGVAYIDSETVGEVDKMLFSYRVAGTQASVNYGYINIGAYPDEGYIFKNWTDENGTVISTEQNLYYKPTSSFDMNDVKLYANFVKVTDVVQTNDYRVIGLPYGTDNYLTRGYSKLISATINEDMMQKTTSTIIVDEAPSSYKPNVPIIIYDPKGKPLFIGNIKNVSGNELQVREPLSIADNEFILRSTLNIKDISVKTLAVEILNALFNGYVALPRSETMLNGMVFKKCNHNFSVNDDMKIYIDANKNFLFTAQAITNNEIINVEEYILNMANSYALYFEPKVNVKTNQDNLKDYSIQLNAINTNASKKLTFGNNSEELMNINIESETQETTLIMIINEAFSTTRGVFGTKFDGSIGQINQYDIIGTDFVAGEELKMKLLTSNEDFNTLINEYLSNAMFNHKITMTVDLTKSTFTLDDFKIGNLIDFYYNDKLYKSIITARRYTISEANPTIKTVDLTLGKVRNNLTSMLNLGKVKK